MRASKLAALAMCVAAAAATAQAATQYTYDQLGRLQSATYDNGKQVIYNYDAAGNRTTIVTETGSNLGPVANPDTVSTFENMPVTFNPLTNDSSPQGYALSVSAVGAASHTAPTNGTVSSTSTSVTYTPTNPTFTGADSFTYTVSDQNGHTAYAMVYVTVTPAQPPQAIDDVVATSLNQAVTYDPSANDIKPNPHYTYSVSSVGVAGSGSVNINSGTSITYTPNTGFTGNDSFTYTLSDGHGETSTATDYIAVGSPPIAVADFVPTALNAAVTYDPRVNDSDPNGYSMTITSTSAASHGGVGINSGISLTYTPNTGYSGPDSFTYTISDGHGFTATATDTIAVGYQAPTAVNDNQSVNAFPQYPGAKPSGKFDPRWNDSDPSGQPLTITSASGATKGWLAVNSGTSVTYTYNTICNAQNPNINDTDSYSYTITDIFGGTSSATVAVAIHCQYGNH